MQIKIAVRSPVFTSSSSSSRTPLKSPIVMEPTRFSTHRSTMCFARERGSSECGDSTTYGGVALSAPTKSHRSSRCACRSSSRLLSDSQAGTIPRFHLRRQVQQTCKCRGRFRRLIRRGVGDFDFDAADEVEFPLVARPYRADLLNTLYGREVASGRVSYSQSAKSDQ